MTEDTKTQEKLKITGEFTPDPNVCMFVVNRPIVDDWTLQFDKPEDSNGSPLVDALFAVEGISRVKVSGGTITLTKDVDGPWPHLAQQIVPELRKIFTEKIPPISQAAIDAAQNAGVDDMPGQIKQLFESHINPALASHGGFVRLVKVEDRDVYVEMGGGCQGCASSQRTLREGIETAIRQVAPAVRNVIDATDHDSGDNPYYA